jgi:hypothetical protein
MIRILLHEKGEGVCPSPYVLLLAVRSTSNRSRL